MITSREIEDKAKEFGINPSDVEKDYVYGWILTALHTQSGLGTQLILKGGNGLRKAYLPQTRFSKDLDFSCQSHLDHALLAQELKRVCQFVEENAQVHFAPDRTLIRNKDLPAKIDAVEARLYFKGFYGEENITLKAQLDITQFDKIYLPVQQRALLHPYSDSAQCAAMIYCQKIEEILASKLTTLLHRRKAIDLFDLLYSIIFTRDFPVDRLQITSTFLKKSIFEPQPSIARDQLLGLPLDEYRPMWSSIVAPIRSLFNFDYVVANFRSLIELLFSVVNQPVASPVVSGFSLGGRPRVAARATLSAHSISPSFFSWGVRNVIVAAGRSQTLIELVYDGFRRLVEPYKIEYYVRKSDGFGQEYFWGYDRSGGKSGTISMKTFLCDKIQSARPTDLMFVPRYPIEL